MISMELIGFYLVFVCLFSIGAADILVIGGPKNDTMYRFADMPASDHFGPAIPNEGLEGYLVQADPLQACTPVRPPPNSSNVTTSTRAWVLLVKRGACDFDTKVLNAQNAGYSAVIVYNNASQNLIPMSGNHGDEITVPSVFVSYRDGLFLMTDFQYMTGYYIVLTPDYPVISLNAILLPFAIVVGICFFVLTMVLVAKYIRDRRRRRRHRLPKSQLKKIAIKKYKKGEGNDVCAICLDEFEDGDKMRVLPCHHQYHCKCVDPWLLNNKRVCPVCKRRVIPGDDSDDEATVGSASDPSEVTPLLTPVPGAPLENDMPVQHPPYLVNIEFLSDEEEDGEDSRPLNALRRTAADNQASTSGTSFTAAVEVFPVPSTSGVDTEDDTDVPLLSLNDSQERLIK